MLYTWFFPLYIRTQMHLLKAALALHAYKLSRGGCPAALSALVPAYLPGPPPDPFGVGPLRYRRTRTGYLLYSVGPDGKDDGGRAVYGPYLFLGTPIGPKRHQYLNNEAVGDIVAGVNEY